MELVPLNILFMLFNIVVKLMSNLNKVYIASCMRKLLRRKFSLESLNIQLFDFFFKIHNLVQFVGTRVMFNNNAFARFSKIYF